ncbi:hypothetical protein LIG30_1969 [Burkholderia sp. lig30]|uniref:GAF domain-containing protein n=1 Tax=Burkholderia sp. lig30 TaxID=1192124 RepID=UPI0004615176|nr:GAF domain-containing protein [Burkholderia sp. lig30]KDB08986.1 hypothetical protein LIG30_1969 [Burkholderia sp. lig30]
MDETAIVMTKLRDTFSHVEFAGSLEDCLGELASRAGEILDAACAIAMLSERQVEEIGLRPGTEFGDVPIVQCGAARPPGNGSRPRDDVQHEIIPARMDADAGGGHRMFSAIVMQGKVIGVIRAYQPQRRTCFSADDLQLFAILALVITKSIQVVQLQNILSSRFTQMALTRSADKTIGQIVAESAQTPDQMARILAKSFYREMITAGFNFNQIIFAASEVISELTGNMRKHRDAYKRRVARAGAQADQPGQAEAA